MLSWIVARPVDHVWPIRNDETRPGDHRIAPCGTCCARRSTTWSLPTAKSAVVVVAQLSSRAGCTQCRHAEVRRRRSRGPSSRVTIGRCALSGVMISRVVDGDGRPRSLAGFMGVRLAGVGGTSTRCRSRRCRDVGDRGITCAGCAPLISAAFAGSPFRRTFLLGAAQARADPLESR